MKKPLTDQQTEFLVAYRTEGRVRPAAARAGCSRELHYNALRTSETYRKAFEMVQRDFVDELEEEMRQRAIYGVKIPKFYRGEVIGYEIRYSDTLLMALMEANDPEKFGGIREELREQDGDAGFCVRWDREEVGRPTLPRMTEPMPPAPPRPPRPPVPPIAECGEPVTYAEWAAARGITGRAACGPVNEETLDRWSASENLGSIEWVPDETAADVVSDDVDADPREKVTAEADDWDGDDRGVDFCVRWNVAEHDRPGDGSALQALEGMGDATRLEGPGWETGWPFRPEEWAVSLGRSQGGSGSWRRAKDWPRKRTQRRLDGPLYGSASGEGRGEPLHPDRLLQTLRRIGRPAPIDHARLRACHTRARAQRVSGPPLEHRAWASQPP